MAVKVLKIATLLSALLTFCCIDRIVGDDNSTVADFTKQPPPECFGVSLPENVKEWQNNPAQPLVEDVIWSVGQNVCSSTHQCYGVSNQPDDSLPPQMPPIFIQKGTQLRFLVSSGHNPPLMVMPYKVNQASFEQCDNTNGTLLSSNYTDEPILISSNTLPPGTHYFIGETNEPLYNCLFGLRVSVVVKPKKCAGIGEKVDCWTKGRCVANITQEKYQCSCCRGFTGEYCGYQDGCFKNPCQHNGTCFALGEDSNGAIYKCICPYGYYGKNCEQEAQNLCEINKCDHGGSCIGNKTHYVCQCQHGYHGHHCEINENDCMSSPCKNGICVDQVGGYQCYCTPGYGGRQCEKQYNLCQNNPCKNHGVCIQGEDQYSCQCPRGYSGNDCSVKVDLCNPSPCVHALECVDFGRSMTCTCMPGYTGAHCEIDINECTSNPCHNAGKCIDMNAGYRCVCKHGIHGAHCEFASHQLYEYRSHDGESQYISPWKHRTRLQNLTLVAGTLGGAVVLAFLVVALCYCKVNETYKSLPLFRQTKGYKRQLDEGTKQTIRRSSASASRPSAEAIIEATTPAYNENALNPRVAQSLKAYKV